MLQVTKNKKHAAANDEASPTARRPLAPPTTAHNRRLFFSSISFRAGNARRTISSKPFIATPPPRRPCREARRHPPHDWPPRRESRDKQNGGPSSGPAASDARSPVRQSRSFPARDGSGPNPRGLWKYLHPHSGPGRKTLRLEYTRRA